MRPFLETAASKTYEYTLIPANRGPGKMKFEFRGELAREEKLTAVVWAIGRSGITALSELRPCLGLGPYLVR